MRPARPGRAGSHLRARVLVFIASLLLISVVPIADWTRLPIACAVYLLVVLPAIR